MNNIKYILKPYKLIIAFILGVLLSTTTTVLAYKIYAEDINFTTNKNENIKNVKQALDNLYDNANKFTYIAGGFTNTESGTTYVNVIPNTINEKLATEENGVITIKKDGKIKVCSTSKGHGADYNSNSRLYHNSSLIYEIRDKNEIFRCDEIDINKNDTITYQISSNSIKGNIWALGSFWIYFIE